MRSLRMRFASRLKRKNEPKSTVSKWSEYLGTHKSQTGFYLVRTSEETLSLFDPAQERTIISKVGEDNI